MRILFWPLSLIGVQHSFCMFTEKSIEIAWVCLLSFMGCFAIVHLGWSCMSCLVGKLTRGALSPATADNSLEASCVC